MKLRTRFITLIALLGVLLGGAVVTPASAASNVTLTGTTSRTTGGVFIGAEVTLWRLTLPEAIYTQVASTTSGAAGEWSFAGLDDGSYKVRVEDPADEYSTGWGDTAGGFVWSEAEADAVSWAGSTGVVPYGNIPMQPVGSIQGYFQDPKQPGVVPLSQVTATLYKYQDGGVLPVYFPVQPEFSTVTLTTYKYTNLPTGLYQILFSDTRTSPNRYVDQWTNRQPSQQWGNFVALANFQHLIGAGVDLIGPEFSDISPAYPFADPINWMLMQQISTGYLNGDVRTYDPMADVSRQAMAAFLYRAAHSPAFTPPATPSFSDVPTNHFFFKEIEWMKAQHITNGNADGTFAPNDAVSRQAMAAFLYRSAHSPAFVPPATASFTDYDPGSIFYKEVEWLKAQGITQGYDNGDGTVSYHPVEAVSRQAMAAFMFRKDH
jgi:hypothetical protein